MPVLGISGAGCCCLGVDVAGVREWEKGDCWCLEVGVAGDREWGEVAGVRGQ